MPVAVPVVVVPVRGREIVRFLRGRYGRGVVTVPHRWQYEPMSDTGVTPEEFARTFQRLVEWAQTTAVRETAFHRRLREHFGMEPSELPVTSLNVAEYDQPNVQVALEAYLAEPGRSAETIGISASPHSEVSLSQLAGRSRYGFGVDPGPVERTVVELDEGRSLSYVTMALFLVTSGDVALAVLVARNQRYGSSRSFVEVMAPDQHAGEAFVTELRALMGQHNVYRRKVISLSAVPGQMGGTSIDVAFHRRKPAARHEIVLPEGLLERVERSTLEFDRHTETLRERGHHLRRGLLLHGPPGTGKTLTATYLADALEHRTVLILTGRSLGLIRSTCTMARDLQPSLVILEDVDLVAEERTRMGTGATALLFELLNEIDGMGEDADVIFVMTTNRAEILEPALASRPGRVDQAVDFPLPDSRSRERLIELFCEGIPVELPDSSRLVDETEGASPAFLRELVRKAGLFAAVSGDARVLESHFHEALGELDEGGRLTRRILGAGAEDAPAPARPTGFPGPPAS